MGFAGHTFISKKENAGEAPNEFRDAFAAALDVAADLLRVPPPRNIEYIPPPRREMSADAAEMQKLWDAASPAMRRKIITIVRTLLQN